VLYPLSYGAFPVKAATYISSAGCVLSCQPPAKKWVGSCGVVAKTKRKNNWPCLREASQRAVYTHVQMCVVNVSSDRATAAYPAG
jgi:hypothetical protein